MGILRSDVVSHSQLTSANASVLFDGSDSSGGSTGLRTANGDHGYALGNSSESITIECWIYPTSVSQTFDTIFATNSYGVSGVGLILYNNNDGLYMSGTGMASDYTEYGILEVNTWYHVALVKEKSQFRLYLDGECKAYRESTSDFNEDQLCIGCSNYGSNFPTYSFAGYISNFRITKRALYKENFTPSKFKLKNIPGTTLLCCQDASDDTTAAVGSIAAGGTPVPGGFGPDLKEDITDVGVVFGDNTKFDTLSYMVPPGGTTAESNRGRGVWAGGRNPSDSATTDYIAIQSGGTAQDFGDLSQGRNEIRGLSSSTRGIFGGGRYPHPSVVDTIDYITIATTSNATDFGNLTTARGAAAPVSNETRGVFIAGFTPSNSNIIDYVTIATTGNATDFGDTLSAGQAMGSVMSTTRGCAAGTYPGSNVIEYITIGTTGNATDFGDLTVAGYSLSGTSSNTRGLFMGGEPGRVNVVDYVTIASTGNATDFGDLIHNAIAQAAATGNSIRGVYGGGYTSPSLNNNMEYVTIATLGNALDYGDLSEARNQLGACSDSHGGIS